MGSVTCKVVRKGPMMKFKYLNFLIFIFIEFVYQKVKSEKSFDVEYTSEIVETSENVEANDKTIFDLTRERKRRSQRENKLSKIKLEMKTKKYWRDKIGIENDNRSKERKHDRKPLRNSRKKSKMFDKKKRQY